MENQLLKGTVKNYYNAEVENKHNYRKIAKLILRNMEINLGLKDAMEDYVISRDSAIESIESTLREVI